MRLTNEQREQVITLRRKHSLKEVASLAGLSLGTVKAIISRSGLFTDNPRQRAMFTLPPLQSSGETLPAVQELPPQEVVTGDKEIDALLWLRQVIGTGDPVRIAQAKEAAGRITTPPGELEQRYSKWLVAKAGHMLAGLGSIGFANLDGLAQESEYLTTLTTDPNSGRFVFAPGPLDDGRHTYLFASEDEVGNRSPQVAAGRFEVDTLAVAPGLGAVGEDDRLSFDELQAASVPFSGTGEPGAKITLRLSQGTTEIVFETQVQSNGIWRIDVPANISPDAAPSRSLRFAFGSGFNGEISVQVFQTDVAGNVSASTTRPVYLRTEPLPEISALRLEDGQDTGSSANDGLTRLSTLNVEGRGPAGMLARLYIDRDRDGTIDPDDTWLSEVAIAPDGSFRATITLPEQGLHHIVGVPYDPASGSQGATQGLVNALPITLDSEVGAAGIDPIAGNDIVTAGEIESTGVEIRGWGEPGARVSLVFKAGSIEDSALANLLVGADGRWSAWLPQATLQLFGNGEISVSATQTDQAGNTSVAGSGTRTF